ncbi:hypothetical protein WJX75_002738 [Coccomyxa subellipsoidea]|uniref:Uncharacterized protein n=1 Tax=Coccomyxa subellipsoidea TaxID=248742 RepID=A0ABR2YP76_9CHLO
MQLERVISSYAALLRVLERSGVPVPRYLPESDNRIQACSALPKRPIGRQPSGTLQKFIGVSQQQPQQRAPIGVVLGPAAPPIALYGGQSVTLQSSRQQPIVVVFPQPGSPSVAPESPSPSSSGSSEQQPVVVVFPQQSTPGPEQVPAGQSAQLSKGVGGEAESTDLPLAVNQGNGGAGRALPPTTVVSQNLASQAQLLADTLFKPTPDAANSRVPPSSPEEGDTRAVCEEHAAL